MSMNQLEYMFEQKNALEKALRALMKEKEEIIIKETDKILSDLAKELEQLNVSLVSYGHYDCPTFSVHKWKDADIVEDFTVKNFDVLNAKRISRLGVKDKEFEDAIKITVDFVKKIKKE